MADFLGGLSVNVGDGAAPGTGTYTLLAGVTNLGEVGKTNALVEVTDFDSGTSKEFIGGLSDGSEITIECNEDLTDAPQLLLIDDVDSGNNRNLEIVHTDGTTTKTLTFQTVALSYQYQPSFDAQNKLNFSLKISGDITRVDT